MIDTRCGDRFTSLMCMARGDAEEDAGAFTVLLSSFSAASLAGAEAEAEDETAGSMSLARLVRLLALLRSLRNIFMLWEIV
jgi:hypothetical protein